MLWLEALKQTELVDGDRGRKVEAGSGGWGLQVQAAASPWTPGPLPLQRYAGALAMRKRRLVVLELVQGAETLCGQMAARREH
mmetsp:Transcript_50197/g.98842  ORF Transcript_50197/g.98842 Transcript_50197/m.98842 type:complete len:83 (+) Transcript_50197:638-886(+)